MLELLSSDFHIKFNVLLCSLLYSLSDFMPSREDRWDESTLSLMWRSDRIEKLLLLAIRSFAVRRVAVGFSAGLPLLLLALIVLQPIVKLSVVKKK